MMATGDRLNAGAGTGDTGGGPRATRFGMILGASILVALCFATRFSPAQTTMEVTRWREFSSAKRTSQFGGKMAGLFAVDRAGFIVLGDGGFAQSSSSMVHTDSPEGRAFCQGFVMYDFPDGSSILAKVDVSGDHRGKQVGTITFVAGTGRFKGITGRGTISCWLPGEWDMYAEIEASFSVAAK